MKRSIALLSAFLLLIFTMTACGNDRPADDSLNENPTDEITPGNNASDIPDSNGDLMEPGGSGDTGSDLENAFQDRDDALTDSAETPSGVSYDQMLRNARTHDTDGNLSDHENAVTPGTDRLG